MLNLVDLLDSWEGYVVKQYPGLINPFSTMKLTNAYLYGIAILYGKNGCLSLFVKVSIMNDSVAVYGIHRLLFIGLVSAATSATHKRNERP